MNIDKMRAERKIPHVALQSYNLVRSKNPDIIVCIFEGRDDVIFYETLFQRIGTSERYTNFVANGKDPLLGLRDLLKNSEEHQNQKNIFFADKDFDGLKSHSDGDDIYLTETYSIENTLVTEQILDRILRSDFRCNHSENEALAHISSEFKKLIEDYTAKFKTPNLIIYHCRKNSIKLPSIRDSKDFMTVSVDHLHLKFEDAFEMLGWPEDKPRNQVADSEPEFNEVCPLTEWRGKFLFYIFQEFIKHQVQRRTAKPPEIFNTRAPITFNPKVELRTFAIFSQIPETLLNFTKRHLCSPTFNPEIKINHETALG